MNIEKPFTTTRKAVEGSAEEIASKEFLDKPEQRHYKEAINFLKFMKIFEPEKYEQVIKIGAEGKKLKDEMGIELYKVINKAWGDATEGCENKVKEALDQVKQTKKLSPEELSNEVLKLNERLLREKGNEVRNDPRIISAFSGKEELLDKGISFSISAMLDLLKTYENKPQLRILKEKEVENLSTKIKKFFRSID